MTDDERAALVEELAEAVKSAGYDIHWHVDPHGVATACLPIIDRLLAAHDLDALPYAWTLHEAYRDAVGFYAYVEQDSACEGYEGWFGGGRGATLNEAIRNAVAQAKAATGEGGV